MYRTKINYYNNGLKVEYCLKRYDTPTKTVKTILNHIEKEHNNKENSKISDKLKTNTKFIRPSNEEILKVYKLFETLCFNDEIKIEFRITDSEFYEVTITED